MKKIFTISSVILISCALNINIKGMMEITFINNSDEVNPRVENMIPSPMQEVQKVQEKPALEDKDLDIDSNIDLTQEKNFCIKCQKCFSTKSNLRQHIKIIHEKIEKFQCDICGATFGEKPRLKYHRFRIHNIGGFTCTQEGCEIKFLYQSALENHINRHLNGTIIKNNNKNVSCVKSECRKSFVTISGLKRHVNRAHKEIKNYKCDSCGVFFCDSSSLKHHKFYTHNIGIGFTCNKGCQRRFLYQAALQAHLRTHNKKYNSLNCKFCNVTFNKESSCQEHEKSCKKRAFIVEDSEDSIDNKKNKKS